MTTFFIRLPAGRVIAVPGTWSIDPRKSVSTPAERASAAREIEPIAVSFAPLPKERAR